MTEHALVPESVVLLVLVWDCSEKARQVEHVARLCTLPTSSHGVHELRVLNANCPPLLCCAEVNFGCQQLVVSRVLQ